MSTKGKESKTCSMGQANNEEEQEIIRPIVCQRQVGQPSFVIGRLVQIEKKKGKKEKREGKKKGKVK